MTTAGVWPPEPPWAWLLLGVLLGVLLCSP